MLTAFADSPLAVALFDPTDRIRVANSAFRTAFSIGADYPYWESMIRNCFTSRQGLVINTQDVEAWIADVMTRRRRTPHRAFQCDLTDGRWIWMNETTTADGWLFCAGSDITSLKTNERTLQQARDNAMVAVRTDPLTGVYSRRFIFSQLGTELARVHAGAGTSCVAVLDLDHFKQINDRHGHLVGDRILQGFASGVQHGLRPSDFLGRIGGEEFMALLPDTSLADGVHAFERLRSAVAATAARSGYPEISYTFSAGITDVRPSDTVDTVFERADRALYAAKERGRNRHEVAQAGDEEPRPDADRGAVQATLPPRS